MKFMPKIQIWKIMPDGELEERLIPARRKVEYQPFKPDIREYETIERMRRVCGDVNDLVKFIKCEWKLFYLRGLRLIPDAQKWGPDKVPKLLDLQVSATWFGDYSTSKFAPLGKSTNWAGVNKDEPSSYLAMSHTLEFVMHEPMNLPARFMFQDTGINVVNSAHKLFPSYLRNEQNKNVIGVDVVMFLQDWVEIEKAVAISRLTGDNLTINRYYEARESKPR